MLSLHTMDREHILSLTLLLLTIIEPGRTMIHYLLNKFVKFGNNGLTNFELSRVDEHIIL